MMHTPSDVGSCILKRIPSDRANKLDNHSGIAADKAANHVLGCPHRFPLACGAPEERFDLACGGPHGARQCLGASTRRTCPCPSLAADLPLLSQLGPDKTRGGTVVVYVVIICHMFEPLREMEEDDWEDEEDEPEDAQLRGIAGRKG